MRKSPWPVAAVVGLAVIIGGLLLYRATSTPSSTTAPLGVSATVPLRTGAPEIDTPPSALSAPMPPPDTTPQPPPKAPPTVAAPTAADTEATPAAEPLPSSSSTAETAAADASAAVPAEPSVSTGVAKAPPAPGSDLPVVAVAPRVVHVVPEREALQAPEVTVTDRNGRVMKHILPQPASPAVAAVPPPRPVGQPVPLNGAAQANGATLINVSGQQVRLFGVRPAEATDVCLAKDGHARPCGDVARDALAVRLASFAGVHCRTPPGRHGDGGSICLDGAGIDLGGFLVGEGLALANARETNDYVGAEGVARSNKRGLWHYR
jgi:endonuclease YncB( thermonuclease family)